MREFKSADEVIAAIKGGGHWRFTFTPTMFRQNRLPTLAEIDRLIQETKISFRGWDFPHYSYRDEERSRGANFVQGWVYRERHRDFWRMYQSGQFVYMFSFWEDEDAHKQKLAHFIADELDGFEPAGYLNVTNICWTLLEGFAFISRLAAKGLFDEGVEFEAQLNGIQRRVLSFAEFRRSLSRAYWTEDDLLTYSKALSLEEALAKYRESANAASRYILERFGLDLSDEIADGIFAELLPHDRSI